MKHQPQQRSLFLFLILAAMAVLFAACKVPEALQEPIRAMAQPLADAVGSSVVEKLGQLLADGKITEDTYKVGVEAVKLAADEAVKKALELAGGARYQFDGDRAMELGGTLLAAVLGTTGLSRIRRGASVLTGKSKQDGGTSS